jgi:ankyrin repeat protein
VKEIDKLKKQAGSSNDVVEWDWEEVAETLRSIDADPNAIPDDLREYLTEGLFDEPPNLTLSLYSRDDLKKFIEVDDFFQLAWAAGYFIIGDRDGDFVCVRLEDLVTYLIPAWSITEEQFTKEKRYKNIRSFLKRMAKDLKEDQEYEAEEAKERKLAIASLDASDPNSMDEKFRTRLILAVIENDVETARAELERGADPNFGPHRLPITRAVDERNLEMISLLVDRGADPDLVTEKHREKALTAAARRGRLDLVKALIAGGAIVDVEVIHKSIWSRDPELVSFLFANGGDPNAEYGDRGRSVFASTQEYPDMMRVFLKHGADPTRDPHLLRALGHPTRFRQFRAVAESGFNFKDSEMARYVQHVEAAKIVLDAGADPDTKCPQGRTLLNDAVYCVEDMRKKEREEMLEVIKLFVQHGADINHKAGSECFGHTPLLHAAFDGWFDAFCLLLELGADPTLTGDDGNAAIDHVDYFRPKKKAAAARKLVEEKLG